MKVIITDMAHSSIDSVYEFMISYSAINANKTIDRIYEYIYYLESMSYIGKAIPEIADERFRELIYRKSRREGYRIVYYVSEGTETIHILYVANCKQDFNRILKLHNYFNNFLKF